MNITLCNLRTILAFYNSLRLGLSGITSRSLQEPFLINPRVSPMNVIVDLLVSHIRSQCSWVTLMYLMIFITVYRESRVNKRVHYVFAVSDNDVWTISIFSLQNITKFNFCKYLHLIPGVCKNIFLSCYEKLTVSHTLISNILKL